LVEQQYLDVAQATGLIEEIAKEVIESFLTVTHGSHELIEKEKFEDYPKLCQLDLRPLVEHCQNQLRRRQSTLKPPSIMVQKPPALEPKEAVKPPQNNQNSAGKAGVPWANKTDNAKAKTTPELSLKGHYTIACIDDSPTILQAIKSFLDDASFTVIMINDPIKALMQVIRSKPDVILLDVGMPNLDGYELCSLLRRHANFKNTPIIMVTGNTGFIDRAKAKLVGASGYLTKPFTQSELLKMVFKHLS
jgi:twitching motility two-component system response regulator PilG